MATLTELSAKLVFKMNSGEVKGDRAVYYTAAIGNIRGSAPVEAIAEVAGVISGLAAYPVEQVTLARTDILGL